MFARITKYKMKPGKIDEAKALQKTLMPEILGMQGMIQFTNVVDADGNGYVVSIVESEETSNANQPKVAELWGKFMPLMEGPPEPAGFEVIANERAKSAAPA